MQYLLCGRWYHTPGTSRTMHRYLEPGRNVVRQAQVGVNSSGCCYNSVCQQFRTRYEYQVPVLINTWCLVLVIILSVSIVMIPGILEKQKLLQQSCPCSTEHKKQKPQQYSVGVPSFSFFLTVTHTRYLCIVCKALRRPLSSLRKKSIPWYQIMRTGQRAMIDYTGIQGLRRGACSAWKMCLSAKWCDYV